MEQIKERPILFSAPMVRAILEGRKTQTRRVCKLQHLPGAPRSFKAHEFERELPNGKEVTAFGFCGEDSDTECVCPHGKPGDRLWVRETWTADVPNDELRAKVQDAFPDHSCGPYFRATEENPDIFPRWKPSIHMPRFVSRLSLLVIDMRVERLQEICASDAKAEGIERENGRWKDYRLGFEKQHCLSDPIDSFRSLWDSINGKPHKILGDVSWAANPWVWVVEFKRCQGRGRIRKWGEL